MYEIYWNIHHFKKLFIGTVCKHNTFTIKEFVGCVFSLECHLVSAEEVKVKFKRCEGDDGPVEVLMEVDFFLKPGQGQWEKIKSVKDDLCRNEEMVVTFKRNLLERPEMLPSHVLTIVLVIHQREQDEVAHPRISEVRTCVNVKRIKAKIKVDELLAEDRDHPFKHLIEETEMYYQAKWGSGDSPELRIEFGRFEKGQSRCHYFTACIMLLDEYGREQCVEQDTYLFEKNSNVLWLHPFKPGRVNSKGWELYFQLVVPDGTTSSQVMKTECQRVSLVKSSVKNCAMKRLFKRALPWDIMMVARTGNEAYPIWEFVLNGFSDRVKATMDKLKDMREKKKISKEKFNAQVDEGIEGQTTTVALEKFEKAVDTKAGLRIVGPKLIVFNHLSPKSMRMFAQYIYLGGENDLKDLELASELYVTAFHAGLQHLHEQVINVFLIMSTRIKTGEEWTKRAVTEAKKLGDKAMKEGYKAWWKTADPDYYGPAYKKLVEKVWS